MRRTTQKIYGKINLTLDVSPKTGDFHAIDSLVASIGMVDAITLMRREDKAIQIAEEGFSSGVPADKNNAVKAAWAFMERYNTPGVDIYLKKEIPVGCGFGSSSADIAGVRLGMKRLFKIKDNLYPLAAELGSDVVYQMVGGYKILFGRGEKMENLKVRFPLPVLIVSGNPIYSGTCYAKFDEMGKQYEDCTSVAAYFLQRRELDSFYLAAKNDLLKAALELSPDIGRVMTVLKDYGAALVGMSGSGGGVFGVFTSFHAAKRAYRQMYPLLKGKLFQTYAF